MKKRSTILHDAARDGRVPIKWRHIGRPIAMIASAILFAIVIVNGESWAIRQAPSLLTGGAIAASPAAGCIPEYESDAGALPVAILH